MNDMKKITNWTSYKQDRFNKAEFDAEMARIEKQTFVSFSIDSVDSFVRRSIMSFGSPILPTAFINGAIL